MEDRNHPPLEEPLKTIASSPEGTPATQACIGEWLGRSALAASEILDRADEGYVRREGQVVELTDSGTVLAVEVVRRDRLAERFEVGESSVAVGSDPPRRPFIAPL